LAFVTRFAPSPTGPLHLGHAYSAILGHDMARAKGGAFLLRMEDTDLQRCKPEWQAAIVDDLRWLGLDWDGPVHQQSVHINSYAERLKPLAKGDLLYPCHCTRGDIRAALSAPQEGAAHQIYPGTCRGRRMTDRDPSDALRLDVAKALAHLDPNGLVFTEAGSLHGGKHVLDADTVLREIGDIVLYRKDEGIVAYFLASAFDDADQGISHVVRGEDLFDFTHVQVILQRLFGLKTPVYHHHALIRDDSGKRLAKRDDARALAKFRSEGATPADIRRLVGL
jgi:glutamyl-Q tRNA(Asp) synthetase